MLRMTLCPLGGGDIGGALYELVGRLHSILQIKKGNKNDVTDDAKYVTNVAHPKFMGWVRCGYQPCQGRRGVGHPQRQARSQPARWGGGLNLDGWNTRRAPPLDIVRVTSSIWKTPPLLDIHKHPPPWTLPVWRHHFEKRPHFWTFTSTPQAPPPLGHCPCDVKGGTKLLKGGTKLLKGGTKLLKGGTKSLGWATGGGVVRPPPTPPWLRARSKACAIRNNIICTFNNQTLIEN